MDEQDLGALLLAAVLVGVIVFGLLVLIFVS